MPKFTNNLRNVIDRNKGYSISSREMRDNDMVAEHYYLNKNIDFLEKDLNEIDKIIKELIPIEWARIKKEI